MVAQLVSQVIGQLGSILVEDLKQRGRLVLGTKKDVEKLRSTFEAIEAVLLDAERRQLLNHEHSVKLWVAKLKDIAYEIDDVLDEWSTMILKQQHDQLDDGGSWFKLKLVQIFDVVSRVCPFLPVYCFLCYGDDVLVKYAIATKIKELYVRLDDIAKEKEMFNFSASSAIIKEPNLHCHEGIQTGPTVNMSAVNGREEETSAMLHKLIWDDVVPNVNIISILGMGGIGKTTLAKRVYNDPTVDAHFDRRIWVCVSQVFDQKAIAKSIHGYVVDTDCDYELPKMLENIQSSLKCKKFLLVLDDVWESSGGKWEEILSSVSLGSPGSRILVTTRKQECFRALLGCTFSSNTLRLGKMHADECEAMLRKASLFSWSKEEQEEVQDICGRMASKCKGLPLSVKVLAGILRFKKSRKEWLRVLDSDMWDLEGVESEIYAPLSLSYYDLPPAIRQCYQFCAVFPKGYRFAKHDLVKSWVAQGFTRRPTRTTKNNRKEAEEEIGEDYFLILIMRSIFQEMETDYTGGKTYCTMHDLVHDFAKLASMGECVSVTISGATQFLATVKPDMASISGARHMMVDISPGTRTIPTSLFSSTTTSKRSLKVNRGRVFSSWQLRPLLEAESFSEMTRLRLLDINCCYVQQVPPTINQLIHLRHLDLSENEELTELPEEICELYNLWTILLNGNISLRKLPSRMGNMVNLKHLENQRVPASLPKSIMRLTSLKTLTLFRITPGEEEDSSQASEVGDLKNMNQLQGSLQVTGLGHLLDCEEIKRADFASKKFLTRLTLDFGCNQEWQPRNKCCGVEEQQLPILEAVRPSTSLETLTIRGYLGKSLSSHWMVSLTSLRRLDFIACHKLRHLPEPLAEMPCLEELYFSMLPQLNKIAYVAGRTKKPEGRSVLLFPKLKILQFHLMEGWQVWEDWDDEKLTVMPCLRVLKLSFCLELVKLPDSLLRKSTLELLEVDNTGGFRGLFPDTSSYRFRIWNSMYAPSYPEMREMWAKISHIPRIISGKKDVRKQLDRMLNEHSQAATIAAA